MSLSVGGYPHTGGYSHPGPMGVPSAHEFYAPQYPTAVTQVRYPDYNDRAYFHNWVLSGTPDLTGVSHDPYSNNCGTPSPESVVCHSELSPYSQMGTYEYTNEFGQRCVKRRSSANKKERRRTVSINTAFSNLRGSIPNVPSDTKLSKIKTLRLAISYMAYLNEVLEKDDDTVSPNAFKAEISRKRERREEKKQESCSDSDDASSSTSGGSTGDKKGKGRTGWPQAVWASELKASPQ